MLTSHTFQKSGCRKNPLSDERRRAVRYTLCLVHRNHSITCTRGMRFLTSGQLTPLPVLTPFLAGTLVCRLWGALRRRPSPKPAQTPPRQRRVLFGQPVSSCAACMVNLLGLPSEVTSVSPLAPRLHFLWCLGACVHLVSKCVLLLESPPSLLRSQFTPPCHPLKARKRSF